MTNPTTHPGHSDPATHPLDLDALAAPTSLEGPDAPYLPDVWELRGRVTVLAAEVRRLRSALVTLDEAFLARRDAIDSNDSRGTPGRRARMAWEDAARAVRAVAS